MSNETTERDFGANRAGTTAFDEEFAKTAEPDASQILARYPEKRSATLPLLHLVNERCGFVNNAAIAWVAEKTQTPPVDVLATLTFYPMFRNAPAGRRQVRVCRTLPCALCGSEETMRALENTLGVKCGETSADGAVSLEFVECLASCGTGPVVQVDDTLWENVAPDKAPALAAAIRASLEKAAPQEK